MSADRAKTKRPPRDHVELIAHAIARAKQRTLKRIMRKLAQRSPNELALFERLLR